MCDLPEHLSTLNHIASPPSHALAPEHEEAFWDFMHTDQLFDNFGAAASPVKPSLSTPPKQDDKDAPPTLESFIAAFANDAAAAGTANYRLPVPLPLPYNAADSSAPTPAAIDTSAILPFGLSPTDDRITGAKKLKQMGAGPAEIEEE